MMRRGVAAAQPRLNVLLALPFDAQRGGVVSVVVNLAQRLQTDGHNVIIFHPFDSVFLRHRTTQLGFAGVQLRLTVPSGGGLRGLLRTIVAPFLFLSSLLQLVWFLRSHRIHVVNIHYVVDNFVYFAICKRLLPIRLVTSLHGRDAFYREEPLEKYSRAFKFLVSASDLIILPSEAYRRKFLHAFPDVRDRSIFIHNGIDPGRFSPSTHVNRGFNRYILCVAELQEYKAIDILVRAAKPLLTDDDSLTLVLAGDGPLRQDLESLASSLGIRHRTMFLGTQGASEIATLLHGCEMLVLPSRMEPFGIVLIEAMASRAPVVATNVGGIPEIVEHEVSGLLVEPENPEALSAAIRRVLTDANLKKELVENGYSRVMEQFCAAHNTTRYVNEFLSVLSAGRATPQPSDARATN
jgi:glycosyltransferase involved in cell wall biosynthesis